jgi:hypothetical protein
MTNTRQAPDHHDADLVLKLYDLRREPVMRASRNAMMQFMPRTYEDVLAATQPTNENNAAFRQVSSYFEMAYGFARHGIVPADFLAESNAEGLMLYAKVQPWLERIRKDYSPTVFGNAEWLVNNSSVARQRFELFRTRIAKATGAR